MPDTLSFSLRGKVVLQCGGSGLLGSALLSALATSGATLVVASRDRAKLAALVARERAVGHTIQAEEVNLGAERSVCDLRDRLLATYGRIDGLVYNAVSRPMETMGDELALWQESLALNATGLFITMRAFCEAMAKLGGGSVVNIASIQGMVGSNPWLYEGTSMTVAPDYWFHKGGMINLTRYLASHYGAKRVRVNAISPGGIFNPEQPQSPEFLERYSKMTMLGRMADAYEIAGAVVFLLSDMASYITGTNLPVDGGYTAK